MKDLQEVLFKKAYDAGKEYRTIRRNKSGYSPEEEIIAKDRYMVLTDVIIDSELESEYELWVNKNYPD